MTPDTPPNFLSLAKRIPSRGVVVAFAMMFTSSYLDNLRGVILPLISRELDIKYDAASWLLGLGNISAVLVALGLLAFLKRFSLRSALFYAVFGMAAVVLGAPLVQDYRSFLIFAFLLGGLLTALGTVSSLTMMGEVEGPKLASSLSLLHVMYGAGSLMGPAVASRLLSEGWHWVGLMHLGLVGLALCAGMSISNSSKASPAPAEVNGDSKKSVKNGSRGLQVLLLLTFATYVAGEVVGSMWMTTYLVEAQRMTVEAAAPYVSGFFLFMAISRALTFFARAPALQTWLMTGCLGVALVAFCVGLSGQLWAFPALGLLGPFYPLFMSRVTHVFPTTWQKMTLWAIISMQVALLGSHWAVGEVLTHFGAAIAFRFPAIMILATLFLTLVYLRQERREMAAVGGGATSKEFFPVKLLE